MICFRKQLLVIYLGVLIFPTAFASEISFDGLPACAKTPACFPYHSSTIGCTSLTKRCFCSALAPINCTSQNCTGNDWYAVEDWYSTQCPGDPPLVNLDPGIPLSARKCIRDSIVPNQCRTSITRNCFCRLGNVTDPISECIEQDADTSEDQAKELADKFYRDTCVYKEDASGEQRPGGTSLQEEVIPSPEPAADDNKLNKTGLIAGLVASFFTIVGVLWCWFKGCCCGRESREKFLEEKLGAPPPYAP